MMNSTLRTKGLCPDIYIYPCNVLTASVISRYSKYGINIVIPRDECLRVDYLDSQKSRKKTIFGSGFLISDRCKKLIEDAEAKAEKSKAKSEKIEWKLSERELEIISKLSNHSDD